MDHVIVTLNIFSITNVVPQIIQEGTVLAGRSNNYCDFCVINNSLAVFVTGVTTSSVNFLPIKEQIVHRTNPESLLRVKRMNIGGTHTSKVGASRVRFQNAVIHTNTLETPEVFTDP